MLQLPNGRVLFSDWSTQLHAYTPTGSPLADGKPTIHSITWNGDGSLHLTGTLLNGISSGASYGDDLQMDSNYPLVRLSRGANGYYARTHHWSSTSVATGSQVLSTEFYLPAGLTPGSYSLVVVANGLPSNPVSFYGPVWVDFNYGGFFEFGTFPLPYKTLGSGVSAVAAGGAIMLKPSASTELMTISKPMTIHTPGGPARIGAGH